METAKTEIIRDVWGKLEVARKSLQLGGNENAANLLMLAADALDNLIDAVKEENGAGVQKWTGEANRLMAEASDYLEGESYEHQMLFIATETLSNLPK